MAFEELLTRLADSLDANTAAMNKMIEQSGGKPAAKPASKPAGKPAAKPAAKGKAKESEIKIEDVAERIGAYLKTGDKETRAEHKEQIAAIMDHYGVERFTLIPMDHMERALAMVDEFEEGNTPEELASEEEDGGEEGESMI
jgi:hypothetical protein